MRRRHQKKVADSTSLSNPSIDLKAQIHQDSQFFDKLVGLIPAKFYLPNEDKEIPWFSGLSKAQKASAKKKSRENIKKARRDRLDPEKSSKTTVELLKQSIEKEKEDDEDDVDGVDAKSMVPAMEGEGKSVTYEELQQRLRSRIEELRGSRNMRNPDRVRNRPNDRDPQRKRKREEESEEAKPNVNDDGDRKVEKDVEEASKELTFGYVKLGNEENRKKKKRRSKEKELEKAKELQELKKDPVKGETISKKHSWKAAADRAAGIKVHDDPKLLKKSLTKEKKKTQKNAQKWKERVQTRDNLKLEKQKKRTENIVGRIQEKKNRRIAKREKKLMRPGFEGRNDGKIKEASK